MTKKPTTGETSPTKRPARKRIAAPNPKGVCGRPFASGPDERRNTKGRGKARVESPYQIVMAALTAPVPTITNGRRAKKPRLRVILDQQLNPASHGDQSAVRTASALLRAVKPFSCGPTQEPAPSKSTPHNEDVLDRIVADYERQVIETALRLRDAERADGYHDDAT